MSIMALSSHVPETTSTTITPAMTAILTLRLSSGGSGAALPPSVICQSRLRGIEVNVTAIINDMIARFRTLFTFPGKRICRRQIVRTDRCLAVAARNIDHVIGLAQSGDPPPQGTHQFLPVLERGAQMGRAGREVAVMQVIGLDAAFDERPHQRFESRCVVIDTAHLHRLAKNGTAGISD